MGTASLTVGAPALDVSVVICAYTLDRWSNLKAAVRSVLAQDVPPREVVLVIDHNAELLSKARKFWAGPSRASDGRRISVHVVANDRRRGLAGARNTGVAAACADVIAFLDDDAEADPDWIERLLTAYADPAVVACGGAAVPRLAGARPTWWPLEFDWVVGCSYVGLPTERRPVRNLIGANMSIRRAAILAAGGFAEGIGRVGCQPLGCEETDLCIRLAAHDPGAVVLYDPDARVHHTVPPARLSWRYFRARCFAEGVSKARVAARVGARNALKCERSYACTVLLRAIVTTLRAARRHEEGAALRCVAVLAGLTTTVAGYFVGRLATVVKTTRRPPPRTARRWPPDT